MSKRSKLRLLLVIANLIGLVVAGLVVFYFSEIQHLAVLESISSSTSRVLVLKDGTRIPLQQPVAPANTALPAPPTLTQPSTSATSANTNLTSNTSTAPATTDTSTPDNVPLTGATPTTLAALQQLQVLPPTRFTLTGLDTDWPVVLSSAQLLPRYHALGWLLGSAYPGAPGNMVLFGHLDGKYATLDHLNEVKPGDTFDVFTSETKYTYKVSAVFQTTPDDVSVMAPTNTATATIITCSGHWDSLDSMYDHRLIVTADLVTN